MGLHEIKIRRCRESEREKKNITEMQRGLPQLQFALACCPAQLRGDRKRVINYDGEVRRGEYALFTLGQFQTRALSSMAFKNAMMRLL